MRFLLLAGLLTLATPAVAAEWAPGATYTTSWDDAISEARETGKMILIYNGWQKEKI